LYRAERWGDALRLYKELAEEYPENTEYLAGLGRLAARRGDREDALRISEELRSVERPHLDPIHALERARIAALLGNREEAMTLLQQAIDQGVNCDRRHPMVGDRLLGHQVHPHRDIDFESLRDYPPFQEFLRPKG
jgi:tetratricopeptide (TPR) repeat protein